MVKQNIKTQYRHERTKKREIYDRVLIVCEGKTELLYFKALIGSLRLSTVNIEITDPPENTPDGLLKKAKKLYQDSKNERNIFDRVYCVFDKDRHSKYQETKNNIKEAQPENVYYDAFSEPCFEYWLLLHFQNTTKPFVSWDELRKDKKFKNKLPNYDKNNKELINTLAKDNSDALKNAKNNPHTNVNELVDYLLNLNNI